MAYTVYTVLCQCDAMYGTSDLHTVLQLRIAQSYTVQCSTRNCAMLLRVACVLWECN
jgi:hypothetical protein